MAQHKGQVSGGGMDGEGTAFTETPEGSFAERLANEMENQAKAPVTAAGPGKNSLRDGDRAAAAPEGQFAGTGAAPHSASSVLAAQPAPNLNSSAFLLILTGLPVAVTEPTESWLPVLPTEVGGGAQLAGMEAAPDLAADLDAEIPGDEPASATEGESWSGSALVLAGAPIPPLPPPMETTPLLPGFALGTERSGDVVGSTAKMGAASDLPDATGGAGALKDSDAPGLTAAALIVPASAPPMIGGPHVPAAPATGFRASSDTETPVAVTTNAPAWHHEVAGTARPPADAAEGRSPLPPGMERVLERPAPAIAMRLDGAAPLPETESGRADSPAPLTAAPAGAEKTSQPAADSLRLTDVRDPSGRLREGQAADFRSRPDPSAESLTAAKQPSAEGPASISANDRQGTSSDESGRDDRADSQRHGEAAGGREVPDASAPPEAAPSPERTIERAEAPRALAGPIPAESARSAGAADSARTPEPALQGPEWAPSRTVERVEGLRLNAQPVTRPELSIRVESPVGVSDAGAPQAVEVSVSQRGRDLHLQVRTADPYMAAEMKDSLGELAARMEQRGYRGEAWTPLEPASRLAGAESSGSPAGEQHDGWRDQGSGARRDPGERQSQGREQREQRDSEEPSPGGWRAEMERLFRRAAGGAN
jgi:hypothetical protein